MFQIRHTLTAALVDCLVVVVFFSLLYSFERVFFLFSFTRSASQLRFLPLPPSYSEASRGRRTELDVRLGQGGFLPAADVISGFFFPFWSADVGLTRALYIATSVVH